MTGLASMLAFALLAPIAIAPTLGVAMRGHHSGPRPNRKGVEKKKRLRKLAEKSRRRNRH
jgi:hypothetical protein